MTDAELIARLRGVTIKQHAYGAYTLVPDPLSASAADRIEALVKDLGKAEDRERVADHMAAKYLARAERLEAAGRAYREATRRLKPCPETSAGFDSALKGDDHVGT